MTIDIVKIPPETEICPECNGKNIIADRFTGDLICLDCGLVIREKNIDRGPEWRAFNPREKILRARTGTPIKMSKFDMGLSTVIDFRNQDYNGNKIKAKRQAELFRMRKLDNHSRVSTSRTRNISRAMMELDIISSQLELPRNVKEETAVLYRKAQKTGRLKSKSIKGMMIACLYIACRIHKHPVTLADLETYSRIEKKTIYKYYSKLRRILNVKIPNVDSRSYVSKICNELNLSNRTQNQVYKMLDELKEHNLSGKSPIKIVGAVIYIVAILEGEKRSQEEISKVMNITEVTIRNRYKDITKSLNIKLTI